MKGVFDMPFDTYRGAKGVNQSMLKRLGQSPAHLRAYLDESREETEALIIGRLTHTASFEPDLFADSYWLRPESYKNEKGENKKWTGASNTCKDWLGAHSDRPVVTHNQLEKIKLIAWIARQHPATKLALAQGKPEQSLFAIDDETGLQLKCRADWLSGNAVFDLKTTEDASEDAFAKSIAVYGYDVQAAFTLDVCAMLGLKKEVFLFGCSEKNPPYAHAVYRLDEESIEIGRRKYRYWLPIYKECVEKNVWPGYDTSIRVISLPDWHKRKQL